MNQDEKMAYVAEHLLGWERCDGCDGCNTPICVVDGKFRIRRPDDTDWEWNPYESADDDLMVLRAVREKWDMRPRSDKGWFFSNRLRQVFDARRSERRELGTTDAVQYEPGDYTDAAFNALQGERTDG